MDSRSAAERRTKSTWNAERPAGMARAMAGAGWVDVAHQLLHLTSTPHPLPALPTLAAVACCGLLLACLLGCCCFWVGLVVGSLGPGAIAAGARGALDRLATTEQTATVEGGVRRRRPATGVERPLALPREW